MLRRILVVVALVVLATGWLVSRPDGAPTPPEFAAQVDQVPITAGVEALPNRIDYSGELQPSMSRSEARKYRSVPVGYREVEWELLSLSDGQATILHPENSCTPGHTHVQVVGGTHIRVYEATLDVASDPQALEAPGPFACMLAEGACGSPCEMRVVATSARHASELTGEGRPRGSAHGTLWAPTVPDRPPVAPNSSH